MAMAFSIAIASPDFSMEFWKALLSRWVLLSAISASAL